MRALLLLSVAMMCHAQSAELAAAVKSPVTLARYLDSHMEFDWSELWRALGIDDPHIRFVPCGREPLSKCKVELITVSNPDQSILFVHNDMPKAYNVYLRYRKMANGNWNVSGQQTIYMTNGFQEHEVVRIWGKPILKIKTDHSENGLAIQQVLNEWFDLTQPDFEPVFALSETASSHPFGLSVGWEFDAKFATSQAPGRETINVTLNVLFAEEGPKPEAVYRGVYERRSSEKTFTLLTASIPLEDLRKLADPFNGPPNETLLVYGLAGLLKIAKSNDQNKKEWLQSVLEHTKDTPEKRQLLEALAGH